MPLHPGDKLGPFEILSPLGAGGMGEVYKARDTRLDRFVALKVLTERLSGDPASLTRFEREAKAVAALSHPNILSIFDIGQENGTTYAVMELLEGETLLERLARGPVPPPKAQDIALQMARGLAAAQEKGIVHRDLKPGNVFITNAGHVKILDFGLARMEATAQPEPGRLHQEDTAELPTTPGMIMGTVGYMAPEQVRGYQADARSDVFAFGVVLYEMLGGKRAFGGETPSDALAAILTKEPDPLPPVTPPSLDRIVRRCLEKRPEDRFSSAHDLVLALEVAADSIVAVLTAPAVARPTSKRRRLRWGLAASSVLLALLAALFALNVGGFRSRLFAPKAVAPARSIAVLPFRNLSGDKEQDYFSDGLTEELMRLLTKVKGLHVAGRTSSFAFKGKDVRLADIGRELHVATVLEGSVRRSGDRLRVSVQLVNVADGYEIWAETYDRTMTEVFTLQDEIAGAVVAALQVALLPKKLAPPSQHRTANPEAYTQYLLARHFYNLSTPECAPRAIEAYEKAIRLDPGYAAAYAGLAFQEMEVAGDALTYTQTVEWEQKARTAADRALALDPMLADGYAARGYVRSSAFPPDWAGAQADFEQALALDPGNVGAHVNFSIFLAQLGRLPEAVSEARKAIDLDPLSGLAWRNLGWYLYSGADFPGAKQALNRSLEINPDSFGGHWNLGCALLLEGDPKDALLEFARTTEAFRLVGVAMAEHDLGRAKESQQALDKLIAKCADNWAYQIAEVYARRGEKDKAFEWLNRAYAQHDWGLCYLKFDPLVAGLRPDPRYQEMLGRMNFPAGKNP